MSDPFLVLEREHEAALAELARLERAALALREDPASAPDRATVRDVLVVLQTAVRQHNETEERALFPLLGGEVPTEVFEAEHRSLWALEQELAGLVAGDGAGARVAAVALEIAALLRGHIERENEVLFPIARARLGPEGLAALAQAVG